MDMFFIEPESSSSVVEDSPSAHSLSPSPTNESSYQDIYDDPRPTVPRPYNYALSPSETPVNTYPDMSVRAYVGTRLSTTALAQGPDGSRVVVAGKDTLRILRVEDPEASQPSGYMNYSPSLSHADGTNSPGLRHSRTYAAAAASDADGGLTTSRFSQKSRRAAKSLSRYSGPNESAVFEDINLWAGAGTKLGFQSSIVDVEWSHGTFSNVIITAFGAGELVSWDLNKSSASKIDRSVRDAHIRSINCIRVSPTIGSALLTASQDGYVKYWDLRTFKPAVQISHPGTAVRALAFSPGFENAQALVGLETGVLLRYDLRTSRSAMDRLPVAHNSAILSIDWQTISGSNAPGWAATGGMDKTVKIWDMSAAQISSQPIHTLHATHAVKQVAWRPGNETELAIVHLTPGISHHQKGNILGGTTSLAGIDMSLQIHAHGAKTPMLSSSPASHFGSRTPHPRQRALSHSESIIASASAENLTHLGTAQPQVAAYDGDPDRIEIWDVRRNWVAKYVLGDTVADGPVTELIWPASNARTAPPGSALWVAYSSGTFAQHDLRGVYRPLDSIPRSGITWETRGVVAFAVDAIERGEIPFDDVRPAVRTLFLNKGGRDKSVNDPPYAPRTQVKGSVPIPTFELGVFVKLARGYILGGASREDICLHNAQVALEAGQYRASQAWHMLLSLLTPLVVEGPVEQYADAANEYSSIRSLGAHLPGTHTPSPHSNQGSRAPSSGPAHGSLQRSSDSPRQKYPPGRSRRPTIGRRASRGSGSGSGHSRVNTRSRSVSISSNSSLKHVGGGALEDESESSDGDISESEPESMTAPKPPAQTGSGLSQGRPYPSPLSRRVRNIDLAASARLAVPNEADEHNLSLMGDGSSDEHLPTDSEPLHNSPTSDLAPSELESDSDAEVGPSTTSLATLKPEPIGSRYGLLQRQDSRSSIGTAKPSLHPDDPASFISSQHKKERSGDTAHSHRASPAASRNPSLNMQNTRIPSDSAAQGARTKGAGHTMFQDRGRSRKPRYEVNEAEAKYRQMGWEAMRETIAYYSERGDLQMSATLATVGGTELGISAEAHGRLIDAYLDMLSRLRLYAPAAYVRKYAKSKIAQKETMMGTTIYSACARCGKTLPTAAQPNDKTRGQSGFCTKCKRFASKCSICRLPARGLYLSCIECSHGGHQECYRSYYLTRPLVNMDGSSTAANSRTNTILESDTKSASASVQSLGLGADSEKTFDDASSVKTDRTQDTLITDPSNRNSLELPIQETKGSLDWSPRGHPCAAGCGHYCWASNERGVVEVGQL